MLGGEFYRGMWKFDQRNGDGFYQFCDGNTYSGEWLNDVMYGVGVYTLNDKQSKSQTAIKALWRDGEVF